MKPSLGINNNIIPRINISMSKNTESIDIKSFVAYLYNKTPTYAQILDINQPIRAYSESNIIIGDLVTYQYYFYLLKQ